ncbi:MAG: damage-control phosphatase ARMT1 family protein [Candidatus Hecatellaceae archaeon]
MKVSSECLPCLVERGYKQIAALTEDEAERIKALQEILNLLCSEFKPEASPARLGALRDRAIKKFFQGRDPYAEVKRRSNKLALQMLPEAESFIAEAEGYERFRRACLVAAAGNALEFDVRGYGFSLESLKFSYRGLAFTVDQTFEAYDKLKGGGEILYLCDNAGEIVLDRLLVGELKRLGCKVTLVVKGSPILNDATLEDVEASGIGKIADRVETIGDSPGFLWEEAPNHLKKSFKSSTLVVAKGMGNFEALTELRDLGVHVFFLFKAKCSPVARSVGVKVGSLVALLKIL